MNLPILSLNPSANLSDFINYWSELYVYPTSALYDENIDSKTLCKNSLKQLYVWKNGMKLSGKKKTAFENKILSKLAEINRFESLSKIDTTELEEKFSSVSPVWRFFSIT